MNWFVSDLHFNHLNIMNFCRTEFKSLTEMHESMIASWNKYVSTNDTVYNLGDLAFQTSLKRNETNAILERLNGKHILIKGNHDETKRIAYFPKIVEIHDSLTLNIDGVDFLLSHYPYKENMPEKDKEERPNCFTPSTFINGKVNTLLHGHTHSEYTIRPNQLCLCWDRWHRPVSEIEIIKIYKDTKGFTENFDKYNS